MITLGIETATSVCSIALIENGEILVEKSLYEPNIHSEKIISLIDETLNENKNFDKIAVSIGPGSFTGLRVGLSTAKGLAYASKKPIVPISTLKALAYNLILHKLQNGSLILPLLDARREEFYYALYKVENKDLEEIFPPKPILFKDLIMLFEADNEYNVIGEGVEKFKSLLNNNQLTLKNLKIYSGNVNLCSAASVALLAEKIDIKYNLKFIAELEPIYLKDFQTLVKTQH